MKITMSILLSIMSMAITPVVAHAQAGSSGGNGGDAIADASRIIDRVSPGFRLLDFYQNNVKDSTNKLTQIYYSFQNSTDLDKSRLKRDIGFMLADLPITQDIQNLTTAILGSQDALLARVIAAPFAMYTWERKTNVVYVDDYTSDADYERGRTYRYDDGIWRVHGGIHQVGRRIDDKIEISDVVYNRMFDLDKVGLLIHEAFYALIVKAPELPYGQDPSLARASVANWFKLQLGLTPKLTDPLTTSSFNFSSIVAQARTLLEPDEVLTTTFSRGEFYRIDARKFAIEFRFESYQTKLFPTKYLQPKLILK